MRRSIGDRMRAAVRAAAGELGPAAAVAAVETRLQRDAPELYAEWRRAAPEGASRAAYLASLIAGARAPRVAVPIPETGVTLWPVGSRQQLQLRGGPSGRADPRSDPTVHELFLHNFGTHDAVDVTVEIAGLSQEFIPRIRANESVEIEWSEERVHPTDPDLPPAEARGYPDTAANGPIGAEDRCDLRVEYTVEGRRRRLDGWLYFWPGAPPVYFQRTGPAEAADHARSIR